MPGSNETSHPETDEEVTDGEVVDGEVVDGDDHLAEDDAAESPTDEAAVDETEIPLDPLAFASAQRDEYLDALRRLQADFENYRKRVVKQQAEEAARGALAIVDKLLPVLDTLDQAAAHLGDPESPDGRALLAASSQLIDVLTKAGLERVDPTGEVFDPNAHEAVGHLPPDAEPVSTEPDADPISADPDAADASASDGPVVGQVMRAGYRWKGNVIRPAMVMVRG